MYKTAVIALVLFVCAFSWLSAQEVPPALMVKNAKGVSEPIQLAEVKAEVRIFGFLSETSMTMTFRNPHDRVLEGDLYFPLPQGATVSGYALDIEGVMVDGVVVTKQKARQVFEKEVRKGVDPGIVEWVKGNNFKTRVFPIPAKGARTIMVKYVADLVSRPGGMHYFLPLNFKTSVGKFSLKVEVIKAVAAPVVKTGGPEGFTFKAWRDSFVAEASAENTKLTEDLMIALPDVEKQKVLVEKAPDGNYYYAISELQPPLVAIDMRIAIPERLMLIWDASGSRARVSHDRELKVIQQYFEHVGKFSDKAMKVDLIFLRHRAEGAGTFSIKGGDTAALLERLKKVRYDGGTQMGAIPAAAAGTGLVLLFTDGLSNFGKADPAVTAVPFNIFTDDASADHAFLKYLAIKSGGEYFNLKRVKIDGLIAAIGGPSLNYHAGISGARESRDLFPSIPQPLQGPVALAGRMTDKTMEINLKVNLAGKEVADRQYTISQSEAVEGDLLMRYWAQKKVEELSIYLKKNEEEITALGQSYGIVTPGTSLIVLERLDQYAEHEIRPPAGLAKMRAEWDKLMAAKAKEEKVKEQAKIDNILALWKTRVAWWEKDFEYPENYRHKSQKGKKNGALGGGTFFGGPAPAPTTAAEPQAALPDIEAPAEALDEEAGDVGLERRIVAARDGAIRRASKEESGNESASPAAAIVIMERDPKTPYITALKASASEFYENVYFGQKQKFGNAPSFYLDCADFLYKKKQGAFALQVLSNIAELELENAALIRVLAHKLAQKGQYDLAILLFEEALRLRPEEPQSHRDLALVLAKRAEETWGDIDTVSFHSGQARITYISKIERDFIRSIQLLAHVVMNKWDRFDQIEVIALMELNRLIPKAKAVGVGAKDIPLDPRLIKLLDVDIRIILTWDADQTDMDLWVTEPSGEKAYYSHPRTVIGGNVSRDFTNGYGPEEYILKKGMPGMYKIEVNYYGSSAAKLIGAVTLQVDVFTNYGRKDEQRKSITLRLEEKKETFKVAEIEF